MKPTFKIMPMTNNLLKAPAIYSYKKTKKEAIKEAISLSGLSRFNNWHFIANKL